MGPEAFRPLQAWIERQVPRGLATLASPDLAGFSDDHQRAVLTTALADHSAAVPRVGSEDWFDILCVVGKDGRQGAAVCLGVALGSRYDLTATQLDSLTLPASLNAAGKAIAFAVGSAHAPDWSIKAYPSPIDLAGAFKEWISAR